MRDAREQKGVDGKLSELRRQQDEEKLQRRQSEYRDTLSKFGISEEEAEKPLRSSKELEEPGGGGSPRRGEKDSRNKYDFEEEEEEEEGEEEAEEEDEDEEEEVRPRSSARS